MAHANGVKYLIDGFEHRVAQIRRYTPANLILDLDPNRVDRLARELPEVIEFLQRLQNEARHRRDTRAQR